MKNIRSILVLVLSMVLLTLVACGDNSSDSIKGKSSKIANIDFTINTVNNDATGNWRIAKIADNVSMETIALDYYKNLFGSDKEIHAIVNFTNRTTTKISVLGNLLDVSVYQYVDKEEHDAKLLFSGMLLKEYHINIDNGNMEKIN